MNNCPQSLYMLSDAQIGTGLGCLPIWDLVIEQVLMKALKSNGGLTRGRGMTESVRTMWLKTMHKFASIHTALNSFLNDEAEDNSTGHTEMGKSRINRDSKDLQKIIEWFKGHNPFDTSDIRLCSLSTGVAASAEDNINCDQAEEIGLRIMKGMDGVSFSDVKLKKSMEAKLLSEVSGRVAVADKKLQLMLTFCSVVCSLLLRDQSIWSRTSAMS